METPDALPPKPKRWPVALLVGFISAIIGAAISAPVSDWAMQMHHVSAREGERGYAVMCLWIPLAFVICFVAGFVVSLLIKRSGFVGYLLRQGAALAIVLFWSAIGRRWLRHRRSSAVGRWKKSRARNRSARATQRSIHRRFEKSRFQCCARRLKFRSQLFRHALDGSERV